MFDPARHDAAYAEAQAATGGTPPQPTLYLHGADDGCLAIDAIGDVLPFLSPGSKQVTVDRSGHFLHVEQPDVGERPRPALHRRLPEALSILREASTTSPGPRRARPSATRESATRRARPASLGPAAGGGAAAGATPARSAGPPPAGPGPGGRNRRRRSAASGAWRDRVTVSRRPHQAQRRCQRDSVRTPGHAPCTRAAPISMRDWFHSQPRPGGTRASATAWAWAGRQGTARHGAGEHPGHVHVHDGVVGLEGEGENGASRVGPDSGQRDAGPPDRRGRRRRAGRP